MADPTDVDRVNMSQGMLRQAMLAKALRQKQIADAEVQSLAPAPAAVPPGGGQLSPMGSSPSRFGPASQQQLAEMLRRRAMSAVPAASAPVP